jgi:protein arginine kinase activator
MKCDNCGRNETNFHYTSNINGSVTQRHLCSECAAKLGYGDLGSLGAGNLLEDIFAGFFGDRRSMAPSFGWPQMMIPAFLMPGPAISPPGAPGWGAGGDDVAPSAETPDAGIDEDIKKRLEINKLREQMAQAAAQEDFEKAAKLRDMIKGME